jgi:hypothetical protein
MEDAMAIGQQSAADRPSKTAVVVIHGIGEQRPLGTIREFVETVYSRDRSLASKPRKADGMLDVPIVPDSSTGSAELRRFTTLADGPKRRTDFFELYWADIMDGTPVDMVTGWIQALLLRSPWRLPRSLKVQRAWRILLFVVLLIIVVGLVAALPDGLESQPWVQAIGAWLNAARPIVGFVLGFAAIALFLHRSLAVKWRMHEISLTAPFFLMLAGAVLVLLPPSLAASLRFWAGAFTLGATWGVGAIITPYAGDVVRYVRATPSTVERRRQVRERGMALLESLHAKRINGDMLEGFTQAGANQKPLYDRIVIVGHSLGTIIAYDLVQLFWEKHGPTHHQKWLVEAKPFQAALRAADRHVKSAWGGGTFNPVAFERSRLRLFKLLRDERPHWRISDLITLGSPLAHAEFLLADSEAEVQQAFTERRFATCPPRPDPMRNGSMLFPAGDSKAVLYPHFASQFAAVKWTNIYDEDSNPLLGDLISGSLGSSFGLGIVEHGVTIERPVGNGWMRRLFTHTHYWHWHQSYEPSEENIANAARESSLAGKRELLWHRVPRHIQKLRRALNLGT